MKKDILTITPQEEKIAEEKGVTMRMTLWEALSRYPQLGQQAITETRQAEGEVLNRSADHLLTG